MNADSINRWLSLGANVGVVIGLILLLVELDQNSDLVRSQIHQARSDEHVAYRMGVADSDHLLAARLKLEEAGGLNDLSSIDQVSPMEARRIKEFLTARHQDYDNLFFQYQQGYLDEEFYVYRVAQSIRLFGPWWRKLNIFESGGRRPSFQREIDRILADKVDDER